MKTRLKACDRWHPNAPAEIYKAIRKNGWGTPYDVHLCRVCHRVKGKIHDAGVQPPPRLNRPRPLPIPAHDLLPRLNWAPPQL